MFIAAVLCWCAAVATAGLGGWLLLTRPPAGDYPRQVLRGVAPIQLAAAVMLAAGGTAALCAEPQTGLVAIIVCVVGAISTVVAGCWQTAKVVTAGAATPADATCGGGCASCTLSGN